MNIQLRAVDDPAELTTLAPLLARAARESSDEFLSPAGVGEEPSQSFLGSLAARLAEEPEGLCLVAEGGAERRVWGLCATLPLVEPLTGGRRPLVVALWVDPELRHRGVARALVQEAGRLLAGRDLPPLCLRAAQGDDTLISMGERWGFMRRWEVMEGE